MMRTLSSEYMRVELLGVASRKLMMARATWVYIVGVGSPGFIVMPLLCLPSERRVKLSVPDPLRLPRCGREVIHACNLTYSPFFFRFQVLIARSLKIFLRGPSR